MIQNFKRFVFNFDNLFMPTLKIYDDDLLNAIAQLNHHRSIRRKLNEEPEIPPLQSIRKITIEDIDE